MIPVRKRKGESGQALFIVVAAMSLILIGALGFAVDGAQLFAQRQMAQVAADAAAQAGIMSIFDGTNGAGTHAFSTSASLTCGTSDAKTPCYYAQTLNGFGTSADTVTVSFPTSVSNVSSGSLSTSDPVNLITVNVQRTVKTTLMRFLGSSTSTIKATATAAIVNVTSPTPIIITHPSMAGALSMNGNTSITICGGPKQSIQINSSNSGAYNGPSSGSVDLSKAGPADSGSCTTGTGSDFGVFGGPSTDDGSVNIGSTGHYLSRSSPILDPLSGVAAPSVPTTTPPVSGQSCTVLGHCSNCPASGFSGAAPSTCTEYLPGVYAKLDTTGVNSAFFDPGIYYIEGGGFTMKNSTVGMCTSCAADPTTVNGMLIYDTCAAAPSCPAGSDSTGGFTVDTNASAELVGAGISTSNVTASPASPYYGILFFEDHNANKQTHTLGQGNGCFSLVGTIYITNTLAIMQANAANYQSVVYHGTPCSGTRNEGEIIVSQLTIKGTSGINMGLFPTGYLKIRQVALVN